jgi:hypothetical protein
MVEQMMIIAIDRSVLRVLRIRIIARENVIYDSIDQFGRQVA